MVRAAGVEEQRNPVEHRAPRTRAAANQFEIAGMKHDDRCLRRVGPKPLGLLAVKLNRSSRTRERDSLFSNQTVVVDGRSHLGKLGAVAQHFPKPFGAETAAGCNQVEGFE